MWHFKPWSISHFELGLGPVAFVALQGEDVPIAFGEWWLSVFVARITRRIRCH